jgi:hypothetical protein
MTNKVQWAAFESCSGVTCKRAVKGACVNYKIAAKYQVSVPSRVRASARGGLGCIGPTATPRNIG